MTNALVTVAFKTGGGLKCSEVKGCRRKAMVMIFGGDGKPMLSRLEKSPCRQHLATAIVNLRSQERSKP